MIEQIDEMEYQQELLKKFNELTKLLLTADAVMHVETKKYVPVDKLPGCDEFAARLQELKMECVNAIQQKMESK